MIARPEPSHCGAIRSALSLLDSVAKRVRAALALYRSIRLCHPGYLRCQHPPSRLHAAHLRVTLCHMATNVAPHRDDACSVISSWSRYTASLYCSRYGCLGNSKISGVRPLGSLFGTSRRSRSGLARGSSRPTRTNPTSCRNSSSLSTIGS